MSVCNDWPGRRVLRRNRRGKMTVKVAEKLLALSPKVDLIIAKHKINARKLKITVTWRVLLLTNCGQDLQHSK
jgi:hypothetical protein